MSEHRSHSVLAATAFAVACDPHACWFGRGSFAEAFDDHARRARLASRRGRKRCRRSYARPGLRLRRDPPLAAAGCSVEGRRRELPAPQHRRGDNVARPPRKAASVGALRGRQFPRLHGRDAPSEPAGLRELPRRAGRVRESRQLARNAGQRHSRVRAERLALADCCRPSAAPARIQTELACARLCRGAARCSRSAAEGSSFGRPREFSCCGRTGPSLRRIPAASQAVTDGTRVVELTKGQADKRRAEHVGAAGRRSWPVRLTASSLFPAGARPYVIRLRDGRTRSFSGSVAALSDYGLYTAASAGLTFTPFAALDL